MARYAVAINGRCTNISKRLVSRHLVTAGDDWEGPVIVKTDRNYGGELERLILQGCVARLWDDLRVKLSRHPWRIRRGLSSHDYTVVESLRAVPEDVWGNPHLVVERFLPEREGELYAVRKLAFFGDRWISRRVASGSPVIKSDNAVRAEDVEPHPEVFAEARRLGLDRGRLDYVIHAGRPVVLDANRTNTMDRSMAPQRARDAYERLALGLRFFWPPGISDALDSLTPDRQ